MTALVVANDVTTGFGLPVAAPGLRAAGLAEGLRAHGFDVEIAVPQPILDRVWTRPTPPSPPPGSVVVEPTGLGALIGERDFDLVVFTNSNLAPHLSPRSGTRFVYDLFAPKVLELLSSGRADRDWRDDARRKERAFALADHVFVNGRRKLGYAFGWLLRPSVDRIRTDALELEPLITGDPLDHVSLVEMPVPLPRGVEPRPAGHVAGDRLRVGVAGYTQPWSGEGGGSLAIEVPLALGHEVHVLTPRHWGRTDARSAPRHDDVTTVDGPLEYPAFAEWLQSMDVIADSFPPTAERRLAMITRTTVALRLGVPVVHGADSEVSDLITEYDAGWVVAPDDVLAWQKALAEATDSDTLTRKQQGAIALSTDRLDPAAALADAARVLNS